MGICRFSLQFATCLVFAFSAPQTFASLTLSAGGVDLAPLVICDDPPGAYDASCDVNMSGVIDPNETNATEENLAFLLAQEGLSDPANAFDIRWEEVDGSLVPKFGITGGTTVTGTANSGSWSHSGNVLYAWLKASSMYYFYDLRNVANSGTYTIVPPPGLSHFGFYAVPIPAAVWLFGSAIAGLAILRRRRASVAA